MIWILTEIKETREIRKNDIYNVGVYNNKKYDMALKEIGKLRNECVNLKRVVK